VRSTARPAGAAQPLFGLSNITLTFNDGIDPLFARARVLERLRDASCRRA
jgi:Cu/Ag efflux pump CusA